MIREIRFVLDAVVCSVLNEKMLVEPDGLDWEKVYHIAVAHGVSNIIAYSVIGQDLNAPKNLKSLFSESLYKGVLINETQLSSIKKIYSEFENARLDYMPLKGLILKQMYPSSDMRTMGDVDILVKKDKLFDYVKVMNALGYEFDHESETEYVLRKKPFMYVELHKYIINPENTDMYQYYDTGWKFAEKETEYKYKMINEDIFIYMLVHLAKHYRKSGIGIKPFIDIWLFKKKYANLNFEYINNQLKQLNLYDFMLNVFNLIEVWFEDGEEDELSLDMTRYVVNSGAFGRFDTQKALDSAEKGIYKKGKLMGKLYIYVKHFFADRKIMENKYPVLVKYPILLPVFWIYRICTNRDRVKKKINDTKLMFGSHVDKYAEHMNVVGLDLHKGKNDGRKK